MIRAIIFDFDGTILDTEVPEFQSWQEIYTDHNCELAISVWSECVGTTNSAFDPYDHLETQFGQALDREAIRQRQHARCAELIKLQTALPGVELYLNEAKRLGLKIGLASSSSKKWIYAHLPRLELEKYFDCIRCGDDVRVTKPDPELYLSTLACLGVKAEEAIAIEDSPNGVTAAKRAGIFCVAVPNAITRQLPLNHADLQLSALTDLPLEQLLLQIQ